MSCLQTILNNYFKQSNGKLNACFGGVLPLFYAVHLPKISCRFKLSRTCPQTLAPRQGPYDPGTFSISICPLNQGGQPKMASSDSTAMCLHIRRAPLLGLSSAFKSFIHSHSFASQSTLHSLQPSFSFYFSSSPLSFVEFIINIC